MSGLGKPLPVDLFHDVRGMPDSRLYGSDFLWARLVWIF